MRKLFLTLKHSVRPVSRSGTRRGGATDSARPARAWENTQSQTPITSTDRPNPRNLEPDSGPYHGDEEQGLIYNDFALNASLEDFPAEIRRHILSMLELDELKALVHASPVYHQQYLLGRKYLLFKCFETSFPNFVIDVGLVHQPGSLDFSTTRTTGNITQLLDSYKGQQSSVKYAALNENLSLEDATSIVAFHFSIVNPLAKHYVAWAWNILLKKPIPRLLQI